MNIALISGSAREGRQTHQVALLAEEILKQKNTIVTLIDVKDFTNGKLSPDALLTNVKNADALLIVSPEYNGMFPGELKIMLDCLNVYEKKPAMVMGVSAGALGGILAVKALQQYLVKMYAYLYPQFVITPKVQDLFADQKITDDTYKLRMEKALDGFLPFIQKLK